MRAPEYTGNGPSCAACGCMVLELMAWLAAFGGLVALIVRLEGL